MFLTFLRNNFTFDAAYYINRLNKNKINLALDYNIIKKNFGIK